MTGAALISVEEYLGTMYHPDCDYVDGEVQERNLGEIDHGRLQILISGFLLASERKWGVSALTGTRVQVKPKRYRIPDICVLSGPVPSTRIVREPPLLCIEILSPEDRIERIQERIDDYFELGVPCVWVVDPATRRGFIHTAAGVQEAADGILRVPGTPIAVPLAEL
jgi:Uma2 family endonuclease